ncbi:MAG: PAS domain S-box protein, partial [Thermoanaerobaculia bacterium]
MRESERRYRQMFENNRAVQLLIDPASGAILDANMAAADFYGYSIAELRNMRIW